MCLVALLPGCLDTDDGTTGPQGRLDIAVQALDLPGVTDADWQLEVANGAGDPVFTRTLTSQQFGDGAGSAAFVGPCDASEPQNMVTLTLLALYEGTGPTVIDPASYQNPGAITKTVTCVANSDVRVDFDVAILRSASQGFFDVAVSFDNIFCSAKLDCVDDGGDPLQLLFDSTGARSDTVVLGFSCTGGGATNTTHMALDDIAITCAGGVSATVDPAFGPGNLADGAGITEVGGDPLFAAAVYKGVEQLGFDKRFWNVALGVNAVASCNLTTAGTASNGAFTALTTPDATVYPFIQWDAPLTNSTGGITCGQHAVNVGSEVTTAYTSDSAPRTFGHGFPDTGPEPLAERYVFVTTNTFSISQFNTALDADAICQAQADASTHLQGLAPGAVFKAWLSDDSSSPDTRFSKDGGPFLRPDGTQVALDWDDLTDGSLINSISITEDNVARSATGVWTATRTDGTAQPQPNANCDNWSDTNNSALIGFTTLTSAAWTALGNGGCSVAQFNPFFCMQDQ